MKNVNIFYLVISLIPIYSCSLTERSGDIAITEAIDAREIIATYHDQYGDRPDKDGLVIGEVKLNRRGTRIKKIGVNYAYEFNKDKNSAVREIDEINDLIWLLQNVDIEEELGLIRHGDHYVSMYNNSRIITGKNFRNTRMLSPGLEIERNANGQISRLIKRMYISSNGHVEPGEILKDFHFTYDENGQLVASTNGEKHRRFNYDSRFRLKSIENYKNDVLLNRFVFSYDKNGQISSTEAYNRLNQPEYMVSFASK